METLGNLGLSHNETITMKLIKMGVVTSGELPIGTIVFIFDRGSI